MIAVINRRCQQAGLARGSAGEGCERRQCLAASPGLRRVCPVRGFHCRWSGRGVVTAAVVELGHTRGRCLRPCARDQTHAASTCPRRKCYLIATLDQSWCFGKSHSRACRQRSTSGFQLEIVAFRVRPCVSGARELLRLVTGVIRERLPTFERRRRRSTGTSRGQSWSAAPTAGIDGPEKSFGRSAMWVSSARK